MNKYIIEEDEIGVKLSEEEMAKYLELVSGFPGGLAPDVRIDSSGIIFIKKAVDDELKVARRRNARDNRHLCLVVICAILCFVTASLAFLEVGLGKVPLVLLVWCLGSLLMAMENHHRHRTHDILRENHILKIKHEIMTGLYKQELSLKMANYEDANRRLRVSLGVNKMLKDGYSTLLNTLPSQIRDKYVGVEYPDGGYIIEPSD